MRTRLLPFIILLAFVAGCHAIHPFLSQQAFETTDAIAPPPMMRMALQDAPRGAPNRRRIQRSRLALQVDDITVATEQARAIATGLGGFITDQRFSEDDRGRKMTDLTLRVPEEKLPEALAALTQLGRVQEEETSGEDVTEATEATENLDIRLENARRLEKRLIALLEKRTTKVEELLAVEKELARVRGEIETMEERKRSLDDRVALATIDVRLSEPPGWGRGIFNPIKGVLQRALGAFVASLAALVVITSAAVPWIAVLILAGWLSLRLLRWWIHHRREIRAKRGSKSN